MIGHLALQNFNFLLHLDVLLDLVGVIFRLLELPELSQMLNIVVADLVIR